MLLGSGKMSKTIYQPHLRNEGIAKYHINLKITVNVAIKTNYFLNKSQPFMKIKHVSLHQCVNPRTSCTATHLDSSYHVYSYILLSSYHVHSYIFNISQRGGFFLSFLTEKTITIHDMSKPSQLDLIS